MPKYIDQSVAIARLTHIEVTRPTATMTDAKRALADMFPADVASVVQCKDCIFWEKGTRDDGFCFSRYVVCGSLTPRRNPTDFCSYGERKEPNV